MSCLIFPKGFSAPTWARAPLLSMMSGERPPVWAESCPGARLCPLLSLPSPYRGLGKGNGKQGKGFRAPMAQAGGDQKEEEEEEKEDEEGMPR